VQALSLVLEMQRTGDAKVEVTPPSPAVSKELEGDWEGAISLPNGQSISLAFHFKNQPDQDGGGDHRPPEPGCPRFFPSKMLPRKAAVVEFAVQAVAEATRAH